MASQLGWPTLPGSPWRYVPAPFATGLIQSPSGPGSQNRVRQHRQAAKGYNEKGAVMYYIGGGIVTLIVIIIVLMLIL